VLLTVELPEDIVAALEAKARREGLTVAGAITEAVAEVAPLDEADEAAGILYRPRRAVPVEPPTYVEALIEDEDEEDEDEEAPLIVPLSELPAVHVLPADHLRASIRHFGMRYLLLVRRTVLGLSIKDGRRRLAAARAIGLDRVPVRVQG
jgi:hypothetical protein